MTYGSHSKRKTKLLKKGLADVLASDPTSVFFSSLRHTNPEALAALASFCSSKRAETEAISVSVEKSAINTDEIVLAMAELVQIGGAKPAPPEKSSFEDSLCLNSEIENAQVEGLADNKTSNREPSVEEPPVEDVPVKEPSEEKPSIEEPQIEDVPVKEPPDEKPSIEKPPIEDLAVKKAPDEKSSVEDSAVEDSAVEDSAVEDSAVEDSAVEVSAVEDSAVEDFVIEDSVVEVENPAVEEHDDDAISLDDFIVQEPLEVEVASSDCKEVSESELIDLDELELDLKTSVEEIDEQSLKGPGQKPEIDVSSVDEKHTEPSLPAPLGNPLKAPMRIEGKAVPKENSLEGSPQKSKSSSDIQGPAIPSVSGAFDSGIQKEFSGVYEKVTQRGGVFDAKSREPFSAESEKKIKTSYLGLKAISFDEALTAQAAKDTSLKKIQSQNVQAPEVSPTVKETLKTVGTTIDRLHTTPVIVSTALICLTFLGIFVGNLFKAEGLLQQGEEFFKVKKYSEAVSAFSSSISMNPLRAQTYYMRGRAYNKIGEESKAVDDFTSALRIKPDNVNALDHRASVSIRRQKYERALSDYQEIFRLQPNDKQTYRFVNAALSARELGKYDLAFALYDDALKQNPNDEVALIGKALCEVGQARYGKAVEICEKLLEKNSKYLEAYVVRGWCYMQLNRKQAAKSDFDFVIDKDPKNIRALLNRGNLFYDEGNLPLALQDYNSAIKIAPKNMEARSFRAWAVMNQNPTLALTDLRLVTASEQYNHSVKFWKARAEIESQLGRKKDAASSYRYSIKLAQTLEPKALPDLYVALSSVLISTRDLDEAIVQCNKALQLNPRHALALALRGFAHEAKGNAISAVNDYNQSLSARPGLREALMFRARYYMRNKQYHSAQNDLQLCLNTNPKDTEAQKLLASANGKTVHPVIHVVAANLSLQKKFAGLPFEQLVSKGFAELNLGHTEKAVAMLAEAVRQNPSDVSARRYLCHALVREDPKAAVAQFDQLRSSTALQPDDERCYRHALSVAATGSSVEASSIGQAMEKLAVEPGQVEASYKLAKVYAAAGMLVKAAQHCREGLTHSKTPAEKKKFQDLYSQLEKFNRQGEVKEDIQG